LSANRAFFGDTITFELDIANEKLLPLPWVEIQDEVPGEVTFLKGDTGPSHGLGGAILRNVVSLGWYRRLRRRFPVQCFRRGYFTFGPTILRSGDPFGFFSKESSFGEREHLWVYPRILSLEELGIPSRDPWGDLRIRQHLFEDPIRAVGTRDYFPSDPLKRIHWKASARLRRLQSKVFDPSTTVDMVLFLDASTVAPPASGRIEQKVEIAAIVAASVADFAVSNGYRVGLCINEPHPGTAQTVRIGPSDHPEQLIRILEALSRFQGIPFLPMAQLLNTQTRTMPWETTIVTITATPTDSLYSSLRKCRRAGRRVGAILIGVEAVPLSFGFPAYCVADDVDWREMGSIAARCNAQREIPTVGMPVYPGQPDSNGNPGDNLRANAGGEPKGGDRNAR
jgi:uncharacterized protein (DUF58 family)